MADLVNCLFELSGGFFVWLSIRKLLRDRAVRGVSLFMIGFFAAWGLWNLYYYPSLGQILSGIGAIGVAAANFAYLTLLIWFSRREKGDSP